MMLDLQWRAPPGVNAAFTTRRGGLSDGPFESLNVAAHVGDDPARVRANREKLRSTLRLPADPSWLEQVHGTEVCMLDGRAEGIPPAADAAVTTSPGRVCVVMVADCLPVLLASRDGQRIAAAHAGWRGLAAGVIERTVAAMGVPGTQLSAWLGPAIGPRHFEVGDEVRAAFVSADAGAQAAFARNAHGRWQADLVALARRRLLALDISDVSGGQWCTASEPDAFFSFRRDGQCGRMAALIWRSC